MKFTVRPLTPALEDLFGKESACHGCWCMYWRIGPAYRPKPAAQNKATFRQVVKRGPALGLLALHGHLAGRLVPAERTGMPAKLRKVEATLLLAATQGVLLDLCVTQDRTRVTQALNLLSGLLESDGKEG